MYLNVHSYYSLRYGTLSIEKLTDEAQKCGVKAMALTDINNSSSVFDFFRLCHKKNIKPIAGMEFRTDGKLLYIALARNNDGFHEINSFLTQYNLDKKLLPETPPLFKNVYIIYPFKKNRKNKLRDNEYVGIHPKQLNQLISSEFSSDSKHLVILYPVTFSEKKEYELHKHLRAIGLNTLITKVPANQIVSSDEYFLPCDKLIKYYENHKQIIKNTEKLIENCSFDFDFKSSKNKQSFTGSKSEDLKLIENLAWEGFQYRYCQTNKQAEKKLTHELKVIEQLGFAAYYLITWDIIRYAMSKDYYHVGRGSGANSIAAYCLRITDVDPVELNLYFERFLNPKRKSPPDFDIDFSWTDRDEIQKYIINKYGKEHAALLGVISTFKGKSVYRELGKVYGLPKQEIDRFIENPIADINKNRITQNIITFGKLMQDFPNIRSIHAGGILISEKPITYYTALDLPPKNLPATQWDMYIAEDIGFEKFDILSQRGIAHICESVEIIKKNQGVSVDIHKINEIKKDKKVKQLLRNGEATGAFYVESPAMRGLLKKLNCDNYLSLVAASSIIRPGVAKSGMMKEYIRRFHNPDGFKYLHTIFEEQLGETYGVMVYQEDVIKICHHFAGLDLADADVLRRLMSGKPRQGNELKLIVDKFFSNCRKRGYSEKLIKEVWRQISSFAGYSFSKAHSASYAVESFQSLYLKAYYPVEFFTAVINNFGGFYKTWVYFFEAKRIGANIKLPCVNKSEYKTSAIGNDIYIGFIHISNLEQKLAKKIVKERNTNGKFLSFIDFIERINAGIEQLNIFIRIGAFRFTGKTKAQLLWEVGFSKRIKSQTTKKLFDVLTSEFSMPNLSQTLVSDAYDEIEFIGFPVSLSYFDLLQTKFRGKVLARNMIKQRGKYVKMLGHLVTIKYVYTVKKEIMNFGTFIDSEGLFFDTIHFPSILKKYPFAGNGVYLIAGTITQEFGHPSLEVKKLAKLPLKPDERFL